MPRKLIPYHKTAAARAFIRWQKLVRIADAAIRRSRKAYDRLQVIRARDFEKLKDYPGAVTPLVAAPKPSKKCPHEDQDGHCDCCPRRS